RLFASFALAGLAGAMKLPGLAIGSVPAWVALSSSRPWTARLRDLVLGGALAAAVVAAVVLPVLLTGGGEGVSTAEGFRGGYLRGRPGEDLAGVGWWYARWVYWL